MARPPDAGGVYRLIRAPACIAGRDEQGVGARHADLGDGGDEGGEVPLVTPG